MNMSQVGHCDSTGNFSGKVLADLALKHGYGAYRIAAESEGRCGHARALVETLCKLMNGACVAQSGVSARLSASLRRAVTGSAPLTSRASTIGPNTNGN